MHIVNTIYIYNHFLKLTVHETLYVHRGHPCGKQHYRLHGAYHPQPPRYTHQTVTPKSPRIVISFVFLRNSLEIYKIRQPHTALYMAQ